MARIMRGVVRDGRIRKPNAVEGHGPQNEQGDRGHMGYDRDAPGRRNCYRTTMKLFHCFVVPFLYDTIGLGGLFSLPRVRSRRALRHVPLKLTAGQLGRQLKIGFPLQHPLDVVIDQIHIFLVID